MPISLSFQMEHCIPKGYLTFAQAYLIAALFISPLNICIYAF
jgi:hypothetical protein